MSGKPAARVTDPTTCPVPGHGSNPIVQGSPDVVFDGLPAARQGDASACGSPMISAVSSTVLINGLPAVTLGCGFHAIRPPSPLSSGQAFHGHLATCSTAIRPGSRSAATQGLH
ncbi:PAAR domain-containing protein, partial [Pseudomonas aeruginosa]|uniref:PAAR domain-containing protein n=1 Tax=Pseudomonas aeruginosa TaxID=287 RepID=UPI001E5342B9